MSNIPSKDDFYIKTEHINTLFHFIKNRKDEQFIEYISSLSPEDVDVNMKDNNGNYLIFFAVMINNLKIITKLLEYGSRLDIMDSEGYSILYHPIKFNYIETIDILLKYNSKIVGISLINIRDLKGGVPIFYAIRYRNLYALQELLSNGADANYRNNDNMNSLHMAVLRKDVTMVKMLVKYINNINSKTKNGSTALHFASNFQLVDITRTLLENDANPNVSEHEYDFYPIIYAVAQNNVPITKLLVDYGSDPNHQDYVGNTVVHYAILNNHPEILDYLFQKYGVQSRETDMYVEDINKQKNWEEEKHIDPNLVNVDGVTVTHLLLYQYRDDYLKYLELVIPHANLNYQDNNGSTPLHIIAEKGLWEKMEPIIDIKKLNIYIKNNKGKTIFDVVQLREQENFINIVVRSYYRYLKKHHHGWLLEWQNKCSDIDLKKVDENKCLTKIRKSILQEKMSIPQKKNKKNITIVEDELVHFSTFTGSLLDMLCGFKYLAKKYPEVTSLFHPNQENDLELNKYYRSLGIQENYNQHIIHFEIRWIYQRVFFPPGFESILRSIIKSGRYKYIIIPIGIILSNGNHSNGLLYDINNNVMERFEPHGSKYPSQFNYNPDLLDEILYKKISGVMEIIHEKSIQIQYYRPKYYLPKIGFQTLENIEASINKNIGDPNGFCTLWTIWYFDYRLKYIDVKPYHLVKSLINEIKMNNYSFRTIIRNYSKRITDLRDSYLKIINRNVNDYLNNRLTQEETKKLLIEILTG